MVDDKLALLAAAIKNGGLYGSWLSFMNKYCHESDGIKAKNIRALLPILARDTWLSIDVIAQILPALAIYARLYKNMPKNINRALVIKKLDEAGLRSRIINNKHYYKVKK